MKGIDPIDHRAALRLTAKAEAKASAQAEEREQFTLARAARGYHERVVEPQRTTKHAANWIASLENSVPAVIWHKPINAISAPELLDAMAALRSRIPETASRVRQRLDVVFDDAEFRGHCTGNPARAIRKKLAESRCGRARGQFAALPVKEAPAFVRDIRGRDGIAARALEFTVLTAARTSEVIGAVWSEFDLDAALWVIPGRRMKGGEEHRVYLSPRALEIAVAMQVLRQSHVFPNPKLNGQPLSNMAMLTLLRRMDADKRTTVHGLARSTFSTWANELGVARPDVIEACLAHRENDRIRAAYNRAQFAKERAAVLIAWADYLNCGASGTNVIDIRAARVA